MQYYSLFKDSTQHYLWQSENRRKNTHQKNQTEIFKYPTIKFRSFTNAFCPCCLTQKQRDCANHTEVNLNNTLKGLANIRRFQKVSNAIKTCSCFGHQNENDVRCCTSISDFIVMCPKTFRKGEKIQVRIIIFSVLDTDIVDEYDGFS